MLISSVLLFIRITEGARSVPNSSLLLIPLIPIGALLALYGAGLWKQWAYLWVIFSIPLSMLLWFVPFFPGDTGAAIIFTIMTATITHAIVKKYYSMRLVKIENL